MEEEYASIQKRVISFHLDSNIWFCINTWHNVG